MNKLMPGKAKQILDTLRHFFIDVILKDDPASQFDCNTLFDQLDNLLLDYKQRQGG